MSSTIKFEPYNYYHIYNKAVLNNRLFITDENYQFFLHQFFKYMKNELELFAYCLLPNHFHFLIKTKDVDSKRISEQYRKFAISYSHSFNIVNNRKGTLFERPTQKKIITSDEYLVSTIYYIHSNPEHHNICHDFRKYKWSSYQEVTNGKNKFINLSGLLELFNDLDYFIEFHNEKRLTKKG